MLPYIDIGFWRLNPYGLLIIFGTTIGLLWGWAKREKVKTPEETIGQFWGLIYSIIGGSVLGGKLGFIAVEWTWFRQEPWLMLLDFRSGWVYWFAVLGGIVGGKLFQLWHNRGRTKRRAYLPVADYIVAPLPLGHAFGRLGCFAQGCCHGRPTDFPWGIRFDHPAASVLSEWRGVPLHPTQIYEAGADFALAFFLIRVVLPRIEAGRWRYGVSFWSYLSLYSFLRFSIEFFRGDERGSLVADILSPSQWISLIVFAVSSCALAVQGIKEPTPANRSLYL